MSNRRRSSNNVVRSWTTETKSSLRTTELYAYIAAVAAVAITAALVGTEGDGNPDPFSASEALRYITYLTIGYMLARGLAKAGSYEADDAYDTD